MPQICIDSDEPFVFAYGGRPYIIPPRHGGRWQLKEELVPNKKGRKVQRSVPKKVGDSNRTYIDVTDTIWRMLTTDSTLLERHQNKIRLLSDVQSELQAEMEEIKAAKKKLEEEQEEFTARLAVATASDTRNTKKKTTRG
tara:strand:- start:134 stop:553 length:420 start_codon:yes stop_codon:yes gene_type:complete